MQEGTLTNLWMCRRTRLDFQKLEKRSWPKLEAALRAMPEDDEDFANERNAITAKIAETKSRHGREQAYWCAHRRSLTTLDTSAAASEESCRSFGDGSASRRGVRRGDRMYRMRVARFGSCACSRASGCPAEICTDNTPSRQSVHSYKRLLNILKEDPGADPKPCVSCHGSLCSAHRGVSNMPSRKWNDSEVFKQTRRGCHVRSNPRECTHFGHVCQSERGQSKRRAGEAGVAECEEISDWTNEKCCSDSTDSSIYTMTVATANVRTLHPKEETESRSRFGGNLDGWESRTSRNCQCANDQHHRAEMKGGSLMVQCRNVIRISLAPERTGFADAAKSLTGERESIYGRAGDETGKHGFPLCDRDLKFHSSAAVCVLALFLKRTRFWPMSEHSETLRDTVHAALFGNLSVQEPSRTSFAQ